MTSDTESRAHPKCWTGRHYEHGPCREPSGRNCIEENCMREAGTLWGPYWCPAHDVERLERISAGLRDMQRTFAAPDPEDAA